MSTWLSEREQRLVAGAEAASAATPIPTQIVSNGEYLPPPQSATQRKVEARINELADRPEWYHLLSNSCTINIIRYTNAAGRKGSFDIRHFFNGLIDFITDGPVIVGVLEGNEAIAVVRTLLGATNGVAAAPGTVRGDFSISKQNNLIHGSDAPENAIAEIALWFKPEELVNFEPVDEGWVVTRAEMDE